MRKLVLLLNSSFSLSLMQIVNDVPVMKINLIKNTSLVHTHINQGKSVLLPDEIDVTQLQSEGDVDFKMQTLLLLSGFMFSERSFYFPQWAIGVLNEHGMKSKKSLKPSFPLY